MRITALVENTSACGLPCEHGLSLYIEALGRRILFDTGQTGLFAENAERLSVDLSAVELCVLSHGHYDHGGGLKRFCQLNDHAPIYMNKHAFEPHYNGTEKYIGLDASLLPSKRIEFTDGTTPLVDGMTLYTCADREKALEMGSGGLNTIENGVTEPDDFRHEHYLLIEENGKRIVISGCSHKGIINIVEWLRPDVLVGGFHFMKLTVGDKLSGYAERLDGYPVDYYTCHCTGREQFEYMSKFMSRLHYLSAGDTIEI